MPILRVEMLEGRSEEMKLSLIQEVTVAVSHSLKVNKEEVTVIIENIKRENWTKGGVHLQGKEVRP
ncbi:tautomerase family protein [Peribacillus asahii]|uniref:tautomerase family protein n=1 Tax=Peribacillus asahii TaxID=228899 RepID=UPI0038062C2A